KRLTWNATGAQACLDAINQATNTCDVQAFLTAMKSSTPTTKGVCDETQWTTGNIAAGSDCVIPQDCSGSGSTCVPTPQTGNTPVIRAKGSCDSLPTAGHPC